MFGDGATPEERRQHLETSASILDSVTGRIEELKQSLGAADQRRLAQYLESVRDIEVRIQRAESQTDDPSLALPDRPADMPQAFEDHAKLMFDLQLATYQADVTRVITFQLGRELSPRTYPTIGVSGQHHATSHHGNNQEKIDDVAKIDAYHAQLVAYYVDKLRATPDGDGGTLLDSIALLFGSGLGNPNPHAIVDLANVVIGGGGGTLKGNQHIDYPVNDFVPEANLMVTLLGKVGVPLETLGDSTGELKGMGHPDGLSGV